jgi:hypothetical protein
VLTLNPDGTATLTWLDGDTHTVRQPSGAEYRTLVQAWERLADALEDDKAEVRQMIEEQETHRLAGTEGEAELYKRAAEIRRRGRMLDRSREDMAVAWLNEVLSVLVGWGAPLEEERLPATVFDPRWPLELQAHWALRPTAPGAP